MAKQRIARRVPLAGADNTAGVSSVNINVTGTSVPLAKLGTVVATVALMFVPNYSAAMVTKIAQ